jgi:hypothetical protein
MCVQYALPHRGPPSLNICVCLFHTQEFIQPQSRNSETGKVWSQSFTSSRSVIILTFRTAQLDPRFYRQYGGHTNKHVIITPII